MKKITIAMAFSTLLLSSLTVFAQTQSREDLLKDLAAKRAELSKLEKTVTELEKALLFPSEKDRAAYANFLRQSDTGLIRLLPRETYDRTNVEGMTLRGGGAYYSFKERTNEYVNSSDISLEQGELTTGFAGANYGLLADLGDVPLERVNLKAVAALAQYTPPADEPHARIEQRRMSEGATINGVSYKNRQQFRLNSTYVLRSVNYHASDTLVAFRVVRIDSDKSAIIIWKLLKQYPTPTLARN
jgi:hypothetical protein